MRVCDAKAQCAATEAVQNERKKLIFVRSFGQGWTVDTVCEIVECPLSVCGWWTGPNRLSIFVMCLMDQITENNIKRPGKTKKKAESRGKTAKAEKHAKTSQKKLVKKLEKRVEKTAKAAKLPKKAQN